MSQHTLSFCGAHLAWPVCCNGVGLKSVSTWYHAVLLQTCVRREMGLGCSKIHRFCQLGLLFGLAPRRYLDRYPVCAP